jgi:soluble lytic murein transglycosylase-like protein
MNLLAMIVFILAFPSVTDEGPGKSKEALWSFRDSGADSAGIREPVCISDVLHQISRRYGIPPKLVQAIIQVESQGNPKAASPKGALGLMQLMPEVLRAYQVKDPFDPLANLDAGVRHLSYLMVEFSGNLPLALGAYNAGPVPVRKYRGIPPYPETQEFLRNIQREYHSRGNEPVPLVQTLGGKKMESVEKISQNLFFSALLPGRSKDL